MLFPVDMADNSHSIWHHFRCTQDSRNLPNILYSHRLLWLCIIQFNQSQAISFIATLSACFTSIVTGWAFSRFFVTTTTIVAWFTWKLFLIYHAQVVAVISDRACLTVLWHTATRFISISLCSTRNRLKLVLGAVETYWTWFGLDNTRSTSKASETFTALIFGYRTTFTEQTTRRLNKKILIRW